MSYDNRRFVTPPYFVTPRSYFENLGYHFESDEAFVEWFSGSVGRAEEYARAAEDAAETAETERESAEARVLDAEAWAIGTRGGEPVSEEDTTYERNAAYYANQMQQTAERVEENQAAIGARLDGQDALIAGNQAAVASRLNSQDARIAEITQQTAAPMEIAHMAADMVDPNKIYVYVGNEAGFVEGGWYKQTQGTWELGGSAVDAQLQVVGAPADAAAAGRAIKETTRYIKALTHTAEALAGGNKISAGGLEYGGAYQNAMNGHEPGDIFPSESKKYVRTGNIRYTDDIIVRLEDDSESYNLMAWAYDRAGNATHSDKLYHDGGTGVFLPHNDTDWSFILTVMRKDSEPITTEEKAAIAEKILVTVLAKPSQEEIEDWKLVMAKKLGIERVQLENGRIDISRSGPSDLTRIEANIMSANVECAEGDTFRLTGKGFGIQSGGARLWAFLDSELQMISCAEIDENYNDEIVIAPTGAARLIVNCAPGRDHLLLRELRGAVDFGPERYTSRRNHPVAVQQMLEIARSYRTNVGIAYTEGYTILSRKVPSAESGDRYGIDCSTFVALALMGITLGDSPYGTREWVDPGKLLENTAFPWAIRLRDYFVSNLFPDVQNDSDRTRIRTAAQIARWGWERCELVSMDNGFADVRPGDIAFWARRVTGGEWKQPDRFLHINHVGIITTRELAPDTYQYTDVYGTPTSDVMQWDKSKYPWMHRIIEVGGTDGDPSPCRDHKWLEWKQEDPTDIYSNNVNTLVMVLRPDLGVPKEE
ncbi:MAG: hypothetical protein IKH03_00005 [Oscillospiraceae bacterium]|nr:hypothetical protein [Oscillospiraceae bacterium]